MIVDYLNNGDTIKQNASKSLVNYQREMKRKSEI